MCLDLVEMKDKLLPFVSLRSYRTFTRFLPWRLKTYGMVVWEDMENLKWADSFQARPSETFEKS